MRNMSGIKKVNIKLKYNQTWRGQVCMIYIRMDSYTHVVPQSETLELQTLYNSFFVPN